MKMNDIGFYLSVRKLIVYEWQDIQNLGTKEEQDRDTYCAIRALRHHKELIKEIKAQREIFGIPVKGYSLNNYQEIIKRSDRFSTEDIKNNLGKTEFRKLIEQQINANRCLFDGYKAVANILKKFQIHPLIFPHLYTILFANYANLNSKIKLDVTLVNPNDLNSEVESVNIKILRPLSQRELIEFVKDNFDEINEATKRLPFVNSSGKRWSHLFISERDFKILELRENGLSFSKITDEIENIFPDELINEDQIKTAYHLIVDRKLPWLVKAIE